MPVLQLNSVKDTALWSRLKHGFSGADEELGQKLATYISDISEEAYDRMRNFAHHHSQFTLHDEVHLLRVTELMSKIMPDSVAGQLNPVEIALLILSAHFHDQGMVLESEDLRALDADQEYKIFRDNWEIEHPNLRDVKQRIKDKNLSDDEQRRLRDIERELNAAMFTDYVRKTHGERSADFVRNKQFTLANSEARWDFKYVAHTTEIKLINAEGETIEQYFRHHDSQVCIDGILITGEVGRHDVETKRKYNTIGSGAAFWMDRAVFVLDIRNDIKPPLTPARTLPEDHSFSWRLGSRWNYISQFIDNAQGRLWEQVAQHLERGLMPEDFWQLAIIYSEHSTDIFWMRAENIWALISLPVLYECNQPVWRKISSLGILEPVSIEEDQPKKTRENRKFQLNCADGGHIGSYDTLEKWRGKDRSSIYWDLSFMAVGMSTVIVNDNRALLELRTPSKPDLSPSEFIISDDYSESVRLLPYSGEVREFFSVHMPFRNCNRDHPLALEALKAKFLEQPSALQEFATRAVYFLSSSEALEVMVNSELPITRWHKIVGSRFMDVDWDTVSKDLHPPYKVRLEDGTVIQVTAEDFERWANAEDYERPR